MKEREAVEELVKKSFLNGALNKLNVEDMERGFHPDFAILIPQENNLFKLPLNMWMNVVTEYKTNPEKNQSNLRNVDYKLTTLDITDTAAVIKVELFRDEIQISTDFISLLKFSNGWKAVAKVSNEHIPNPFNL